MKPGMRGTMVHGPGHVSAEAYTTGVGHEIVVWSQERQDSIDVPPAVMAKLKTMLLHGHKA